MSVCHRILSTSTLCPLHLKRQLNSFHFFPNSSILQNPISSSFRWNTFFNYPPTPIQPNFCQIRKIGQVLRPKKMAHKKSHKGTYPVRIGGSLRGTNVVYGDFGLQMLRGIRLTEKQLDNVRTGIRRVLKGDKSAKLIFRCFPDRPVTAKASETRMGAGKGAVDYFATWIARNRIIFELKGCRKEIAEKAFRVAAGFLPVPSRMIVKNPSQNSFPRVLPAFMQKVNMDLLKAESIERRWGRFGASNQENH